jgi:hypothetical protein
MTPEQVIMALITLILGGGGSSIIVGMLVTRKLGIKASQNEANRDLNTTWDAIVESLQNQITNQSVNFKAELERLGLELTEMKKRQLELEGSLNMKERIVLKALAHIIKLEALILPNPIPPRPEGLE